MSQKTFSEVKLSSFEAANLVSQAHRSFQALLATCLAHHGLTIPQWSALGVVRRQGTTRPSEIAEALGYRPPFASVVVRELVGLRLVVASHDPDDDRVKEVSLTSLGEQRVPIIEAGLCDCLDGQFTGVDGSGLSNYFKFSQYIANHVRHKGNTK